MKEQHIKVIICAPDKVAYAKEIKNNGDTIRKNLGGLMESHHPFWPEKNQTMQQTSTPTIYKSFQVSDEKIKPHTPCRRAAT